MTKNYMEILVSNLLSEVIVNYDVCKCENCLNDIKAIVLNNLSPMYFLSSVGKSEKTAFLLNRQNRISVLAKIVSALEIIKKNEHNSGSERNCGNNI